MIKHDDISHEAAVGFWLLFGLIIFLIIEKCK